MDELITVIIPVYNVEPYLDRCMRSVLDQSYKNLEVILVDDRSIDRSNEMCLDYLSDTRVINIHGDNKGLSAARNKGLDMSHGKYVVFVDSDDHIETNMIENLYRCMKDTGSDTVIGGFRRAIGNKIEIRKNQFVGKIYDNTDDIKNLVLKKMIATNGVNHLEMSVWKVLFSMDIIQNNNLRFPDKRYLCEDIIFDFAYYPLAKKVAMSEDTGYCYCLNEDSLSQMYQKNKFERISFQAAEMKKEIEKNHFDEEAYIRLDNFYIGNLIHHMKTMAACNKKIGRKECILEYRKICNTKNVRNTRWESIKRCYSGRDRIPFYLMKKNKVHLLYLYLVLLTKLRKIIR